MVDLPDPQTDPQKTALEDFLNEHNAWCVWETKVEGAHPFTLSAYRLYKGLIIVQRYGHRPGWDIYVQAEPHSLSMQATFQAALKAVQ